MMSAPCFAGVLRPSIFVAFQETLTPGVYSFTPAVRAPGAISVRLRGTGGGGGAGQTVTPGQSGGGGGGGFFDRTIVFAPGDTAVTINITVGAGGTYEVNGVDTTVTAAFTSPINMTGQGGRRGLDASEGLGGTATGGTTNTPGDPGLSATLEPHWVPGPGGSPNGGQNSPGGNGSLLIDWS